MSINLDDINIIRRETDKDPGIVFVNVMAIVDIVFIEVRLPKENLVLVKAVQTWQAPRTIENVWQRVGLDVTIVGVWPIDGDNSYGLRKNILNNIKRVIQTIVVAGNRVIFHFHPNVAPLHTAGVDVAAVRMVGPTFVDIDVWVVPILRMNQEMDIRHVGIGHVVPMHILVVVLRETDIVNVIQDVGTHVRLVLGDKKVDTAHIREVWIENIPVQVLRIQEDYIDITFLLIITNTNFFFQGRIGRVVEEIQRLLGKIDIFPDVEEIRILDFISLIINVIDVVVVVQTTVANNFLEAIEAVAIVTIYVAFMEAVPVFGIKRREKVIVLVSVLDDDIRVTIMRNVVLDDRTDAETIGQKHVVTSFVLAIIGVVNGRVALFGDVVGIRRLLSIDFKGHPTYWMVVINGILVKGIQKIIFFNKTDVTNDGLRIDRVDVLRVAKNIYGVDFLNMLREDVNIIDVRQVEGIVFVYLNNMDLVMVNKMSIINGVKITI